MGGLHKLGNVGLDQYVYIFPCVETYHVNQRFSLHHKGPICYYHGNFYLLKLMMPYFHFLLQSLRTTFGMHYGVYTSSRNVQSELNMAHRTWGFSCSSQILSLGCRETLINMGSFNTWISVGIIFTGKRGGGMLTRAGAPIKHHIVFIC